MIQLQYLYCEIDNGSKTLLDPLRRQENLLCVCVWCACAHPHVYVCVRTCACAHVCMYFYRDLSQGFMHAEHMF